MNLHLGKVKPLLLGRTHSQHPRSCILQMCMRPPRLACETLSFQCPTWHKSRACIPLYLQSVLIPCSHNKVKPSIPSVTASSPQLPPTPVIVRPSRPSSQVTSTFSMSRGLAASLGERGVTPSKLCPTQTFPQRFESIVTETRSSSNFSQTQGAYSSSSMFLRPIEGVDSDSSSVVAYRPQEAYLNLVSRVEDIGLNSIIDIASKTGLTPVKLDPIDVGLNTIMSIKRNKGTPSKPHARVRRISGTRHRAPTVLTRSTHVSKPPILGDLPQPLDTTPSVVASHLGYASMPLPNTAPLHVQASHPVTTVTASSRASHTTPSSRPLTSTPACPRPSSLKLTPLDLSVMDSPPTTSASSGEGVMTETWGLGWLGNLMSKGSSMVNTAPHKGSAVWYMYSLNYCIELNYECTMHCLVCAQFCYNCYQFLLYVVLSSLSYCLLNDWLLITSESNMW